MFESYILKYKTKKAVAMAKDLCDSIFTMYQYFASTHPQVVRPSDFVKESIPFIVGWQAASRNVFKHEKGGVFEVRPDDSLFDIVKQMSDIEAGHLANTWPKANRADLQNEAIVVIRSIFRANKLSV